MVTAPEGFRRLLRASDGFGVPPQAELQREFERLEGSIPVEELLRIRTNALLQLALEDAAVHRAFGGYKLSKRRLVPEDPSGGGGFGGFFGGNEEGPQRNVQAAVTQSRPSPPRLADYPAEGARGAGADANADGGGAAPEDSRASVISKFVQWSTAVRDSLTDTLAARTEASDSADAQPTLYVTVHQARRLINQKDPQAMERGWAPVSYCRVTLAGTTPKIWARTKDSKPSTDPEWGEAAGAPSGERLALPLPLGWFEDRLGYRWVCVGSAKSKPPPGRWLNNYKAKGEGVGSRADGIARHCSCAVDPPLPTPRAPMGVPAATPTGLPSGRGFGAHVPGTVPTPSRSGGVPSSRMPASARRVERSGSAMGWTSPRKGKRHYHVSAELENALARFETEFSERDVDSFHLPADLTTDDYVKAGNLYFTPAHPLDRMLHVVLFARGGWASRSDWAVGELMIHLRSVYEGAEAFADKTWPFNLSPGADVIALHESNEQFVSTGALSDPLLLAHASHPIPLSRHTRPSAPPPMATRLPSRLPSWAVRFRLPC